MAHLGMMEALLEYGVRLDVLSGSSAGSLIGSLYARGYPPRDILEISKKTNFLKLVRPALNWRGLLKIESSTAFLHEYLPETFEDLYRPLTVACTDVNSGKVKYFEKGDLVRVILASCSIPVVFEPVDINSNQYIDGGILDNLPLKPLKEKANYFIGLHCNPIGKGFKQGNWKDLMERSLLMAISSATYEKKKKFDIFMEPPLLSSFNIFDFKRAEEMFDIGYEFANEYLSKTVLSKKLIKK